MKAAKQIELLIVFLVFKLSLYSQQPGLNQWAPASEEIVEQTKEIDLFSFSTQGIQQFDPFFIASNPFQLKETYPLPLTLRYGGKESIDLPGLAPRAFFCRMEWKLEQYTKIPVRFRLGSLEYTNRLEGKNSFIE